MFSNGVLSGDVYYFIAFSLILFLLFTINALVIMQQCKFFYLDTEVVGKSTKCMRIWTLNINIISENMEM